MYISFIRPLLEYGDVVWDNCSAYLQSELEAIQTEAARIVTGATKLCNIQGLMADLKWDTLASRRKKHRLVQMNNGMTPDFLTSLIPPLSQVRYPLRNSDNIPLPVCRTQSYASSFLPATIRDWNSLPISTRQSESVPSFKYKLRTHSAKPSLLYNVGSRRNQIMHCRLRLGCSSLNHDLHRKNIIDSPLCTCNAIENASHFLMICPLYSAQRQRCFSHIPCALTLQNLLFGDEHLTFDQNKNIFLCVQRFISISRRFDA